jgi:nucleoside phosphorylase
VCWSAITNDRTAVLGAFGEEAKLQRDAIADVEESNVFGMCITTGHYGDLTIVHALTGHALASAAMAATLVLDHFGPDIVLLSAIAGGLNPGPSLKDVVVSERTIQHECGQMLSEGFRVWGTCDRFTDSENPLCTPETAVFWRLLEISRKRLHSETPSVKRVQCTPRW